MDIDKLLQLMINKDGSDLFITADVAPSMKVNGKIFAYWQDPAYCRTNRQAGKECHDRQPAARV